MKKTKFIVIGIVVALMLVGGAYAAWASQAELSVNASSGELDVEISEVSVGEVSDYVEFDKQSVQISEDKKSASVSIENLYPGAAANVTFMVTNSGSLPVALDKAVQQLIQVVDTKTNEKVSHSLMAALDMGYKCYVADAKGKVVANIGSINVNGGANTSTMFLGNKAVISPGEKVVLELVISMKESADESVENKLFKFTVTPFFTQGV